MKLEKAIELLIIAIEGFPCNDTEKYYKAMELGIEALKGIQNCRHYPECLFIDLLPGETED